MRCPLLSPQGGHVSPEFEEPRVILCLSCTPSLARQSFRPFGTTDVWEPGYYLCHFSLTTTVEDEEEEQVTGKVRRQQKSERDSETHPRSTAPFPRPNLSPHSSLADGADANSQHYSQLRPPFDHMCPFASLRVEEIRTLKFPAAS